jgi:mannose-1-phosphate guanylyltransferase
LIYAVILAGGKGERFWPISRSSFPKQLISIASDKNMLEETIERIRDFVPLKQTLVITGANIKNAVLKNVPSLKEENIIAEPEGKNTCLAIGLAAIHLRDKDPEAIMVVLSSDHLIKPKDKFIQKLQLGTEVVSKNKDFLLTIGIVPTRAETAYGYIELDELYSKFDEISVYRVKQFKEKPDRIVAQEYYHDRKHLWNAGMFIWRADSILRALEKYAPTLYHSLLEHQKALGTKKEKESLIKLYSGADDISIDYAVLEKAENVLCMRADIIWDDMGSWLALDRVRERDEENNVIVGRGLAVDSYETVVYNNQGGIIVVLGVSDLVVVKTNEVVFVAHKTKVTEIKELLKKLSEDQELKKLL